MTLAVVPVVLTAVLAIVLRPWQGDSASPVLTTAPTTPAPTTAAPASSVVATSAVLGTQVTPPSSSGSLVATVGVDGDAYSDASWNVAFGSPIDPPVAAPSSWLDWALLRGGVPVRVSNLRMTIINSAGSTFQIRDIRAVVTRREPVLAGSRVHHPTGGLNPIIQLGFDLDSGDVVRAVEIDPDSGKAATVPLFDRQALSLAAGESTELKLRVTAADCHCQFTFEIVGVDSTGASVTFRPAGSTFAVTGTAPAYAEAWEIANLPCNRPGLAPIVDGKVTC